MESDTMQFVGAAIGGSVWLISYVTMFGGSPKGREMSTSEMEMRAAYRKKVEGDSSSAALLGLAVVLGTGVLAVEVLIWVIRMLTR